MKNLLTHYAAGLCAPPLKLPDKQPTAYSYNGVVLPDIETVYTPEMQETHPFAVISEHESSAIYLTVCDKELYQNGKYLSTLHKDPDTGSTGGTGTSSFMRWIYNADANTWDIEISDGSQSRTMAVGLAIWANNDVFYRYDVEDVGGTLYLAASEPVPVGGGADNPVQGALLSSDGYTLMDSNGTYLITKENE